MVVLSLAIAAGLLAAAARLSPAVARARTIGGAPRQGLAQPGDNGILVGATAAPHDEGRYHDAGRRGRTVGHRVPVR